MRPERGSPVERGDVSPNAKSASRVMKRALPRSTTRVEPPGSGQTVSGWRYSPGPWPSVPMTSRLPPSMSTA